MITRAAFLDRAADLVCFLAASALLVFFGALSGQVAYAVALALAANARSLLGALALGAFLYAAWRYDSSDSAPWWGAAAAAPGDPTPRGACREAPGADPANDGA